MKITNKYFRIEPEVAGQLGKNTIIRRNTQTHTPIVESLHYEFDGWLGDDILESFPCFVCTSRMATLLEEENLNGYLIASCEITKSQFFIDTYPERKLPDFVWLKIIGRIYDDFFVDKKGVLIVSGKALNAIKKLNLNHCLINEY